MKDWDLFLWPYQQAVSELKVKFRSLRQSFLNKGEHSPIEFVVGRVKTVDSIKEKMTRRVIAPDVIENDMQDIAGIRIMCQFVDDIYRVVDLIHQRQDMQVIEERDYIQKRKTVWISFLPYGNFIFCFLTRWTKEDNC